MSGIAGRGTVTSSRIVVGLTLASADSAMRRPVASSSASLESRATLTVFARQALHAWRLTLPLRGTLRTFEAPWPAELDLLVI